MVSEGGWAEMGTDVTGTETFFNVPEHPANATRLVKQIKKSVGFMQLRLRLYPKKTR